MNNKVKDIIDHLIKCKNEDKEMKYQPEDILTIKDVWLLLDYITNLQEKNKQLKDENARLKLKPLEGIFAQVDDDMLLRSCGAMQQEVDNYKSILTELEKKLNQEIDEGRSETNLWLMGIYDYAKEILLFIQELKEKYKC